MSLKLGNIYIAGMPDISGKANTSLNNLDATGQAVFDEKANTALDNLTSIGKNIGNWSSNVTNCITYIPQDIKMELSGGTYTLKAGSKVCVPNGFDSDGITPKFDIIEIENDLSVYSVTNVDMFIYYDLQNNVLRDSSVNNSGSGTVVPSSTGLFYNTSTNSIDMYNNGSARGYIGSFPLCKNFCNDTTKKTIDQIFNGFGYIGSTVFALPGVKGLIPNGRNEDGTLNNTTIFVNSVTTVTVPGNSWVYCWIDENGKIDLDRYFYISNMPPSVSSDYGHWLDTTTNKFYRRVSGSWVYTPGVIVASQTVEQSSPFKITSFTPKTVFRSLDYNDKETIAGWGMPGSNKYIDLTLGATATDYIAPANGWFSVGKTASAANQYLNMYIRIGNTNVGGFGLNSVANGQTTRLAIPCFKGNKIQITYNMNGSSTYDYFRFIYAEGENV